MDASQPDAYSLFQADIINKLRDRPWFIDCIGFNYNFLAEIWGCRTVLSARRLGEAFDFWIEDQTRTLTEGIATGSKELDHFKHASFISFWLRRMLPINETQVLGAGYVIGTSRRDVSPSTLDANQKFFLRYGNELCALLIGLQICLFYEASVIRADENVYEIRPNRTEYLLKCTLPKRTIEDFVMILKHKNMSPHALYLLYKSLFTTLSPI